MDNHEKLARLVATFAAENGGAVEEPEMGTRCVHRLATTAGVFRCRVVADRVFGEFADVEAARRVVEDADGRLNPFTGRWCFGEVEHRSAEDVMLEFRLSVEPLLVRVPS